MRGHRGAVRRRPLARLAPVTLLVSGLVACTESPERPDAAPSPTETALSAVDLTGVVVDRTSFCDALDTDSVAAVLGGEPERADSYDSGQRVELAPGLRDVAHEYSCLFERGVRTARAWVFAQPVTTRQARSWIEERETDDRCHAAGELVFGEPGLVQSCAQGTRRRVTAVGLFGDGWLSCQATAPASLPEAELLTQAQRWCADVARNAAP